MNHLDGPCWEDPHLRKARLRNQFWRDLFAKGAKWGRMMAKPIRATTDAEVIEKLIVQTGGRTW